MTTQAPDIEILSPETPVASTVADPPPPDSRYQHRYDNGKRCRLPGLESQSGLCFRHFRLKVAAALPPSLSDSDDLSADLLPELSEFSSGDDILKFLARLLVLVTKGRVSPRRASVLAYITNQLLHSHSTIQKEAESEPQQIIFGLPRPKRD
jgi:hypothetical protein